ncbi:RNA-guided endonuclease TnpB family protein [Lentzea sp. NBC_00516]|uniref:RNA-guided endonuclease InsQ/TnpB family protein n=1 Tax=Lentzea sp. NBC_00516 TaxID=2903582 RepID=UPI002E81FAC4|nr:transposase [Lentzea sp. NBC_00516]WUD23302.1 RNA-guided endonuclease TnpB family protein [Lentzea sp. NBC_00516]
MLIGMKQVVQVRLLPTPEQASALLVTLRACNAAASWLAGRMHAAGEFRKFDVQKRFYTELRERFGLAAQPAIRVIGKTTDAYTALRGNLTAGNYGPPGSTRRRKVVDTPIVFRPDAAQPFDARCLSWQLGDSGREGTVSVWSTAGRLRNVRIMGHPGHLALLRSGQIRETDLICRDGVWVLHAVVDRPGAPQREPVNGFLGIDMGIVNLATTSDGDRMSGARLNRYRRRQQRLRKRLQAKKTSSARRLLKKRRRKENRFAADVNHQISKRIVAEAERTGRGIAVEQLTGIRDRVRLRKPQRATLSSWAFAQLGRFLAYKAEQAGLAFVQVDPAYTSQRCSDCGVIDKKNRRSQASYVCGRCGFVGHADHNAARNIATRGVAGWGEVMRPHAAPTLAAGQGGSSKPVGTPGT